MNEHPSIWEISVIILSIIAIIISVVTWIKTRPAEQKQMEINVKQSDHSSMLTCFQILSSDEAMDSKRKIADNFKVKRKQGKNIIFNSGSISTDAYRVKHAFNQVSLLYKLSLVNQEYFEQSYGGSVVRFWKILEEDIKLHQKDNPEYAKHFENVAKIMMEKGYDDEPY